MFSGINSFVLCKTNYSFYSCLSDLSVIDPRIIYEFLDKSPQLILEYVKEHVSKEQLITWLDLKTVERLHDNLSINEFHGNK